MLQTCMCDWWWRIIWELKDGDQCCHVGPCDSERSLLTCINFSYKDEFPQMTSQLQYKSISSGRETVSIYANKKHSSYFWQVAQLWQRDPCEAWCFRLTSSVIRKIMHKNGFFGHPMGASGAMYAIYLKFSTKRNLVGEFHRQNVSFTRKTANLRFWATFFGDEGLEVTYAIHD